MQCLKILHWFFRQSDEIDDFMIQIRDFEKFYKVFLVNINDLDIITLVWIKSIVVIQCYFLDTLASFIIPYTMEEKMACLEVIWGMKQTIKTFLRKDIIMFKNGKFRSVHSIKKFHLVFKEIT